MMTIERLLAKLQGVKRSGDGWSARCPAHEDENPSLSIANGKKGIVLHCHAGCTIDAITAALGITKADLFNGKSNGKRRKNWTNVATYPYEDETGKVLFEVCRTPDKDFPQRRPDGKGGWIWRVKGVRKVPFHLPQLLKAVAEGRPIYICEGEKDVLAMEKAGFAATCNSGGAGKWPSSFGCYLRGATVVIIADKDKTGLNHAADVASKLQGIAATAKIIELPDTNGQRVKDAHDFFAAGGTVGTLAALVAATLEWTLSTLMTNHPPEEFGFSEVTAWIRKEMLKMLADKDTLPTVKHTDFAGKVVEALGKIGRFYFHADLRDYDSAMFFDRHRKRLERIRSDAFGAWLSDWLVVNRATGVFKYIMAAIETAALSSARTQAILPESFWASRGGALYLSNGDGAIVRITAAKVETVDNGTDGVLFAAGRTLAPWNLTTPQDPFEVCSLFRNTHSGVLHGKDVLRLWFYSFATMPKSKPPLGLIGEIGSGKTRTLKGVAELYGIPFRAAKVEEQLEQNFWPNINEGGLFVCDNADSRSRWLPDAIAAAATDGCSQRRKLYTNSETVTLRANAWLALTSANPTFGNDAGLSDRLLLVRMERRDEETSDAALTEEILASRDAGLSHIAETLRAALADKNPTPLGLNARHPDFAAFAVRIGRALGREAQTVAALQAAEADKSSFCLENDPIACALRTFLSEAHSFNGTAAELLPCLVSIDKDLEGKVSVKRLGKRLSALWPHLRKVLAKASKESDRTGLLHFTFSIGADYADFQTDFPQKS
jgi:hypothetical protein